MKEYNFLIECDESECNYWMSFVSWYSIVKNIPNSKVFLNKSYKWASKVGVCKLKNKQNNFNLILSPSVVAVRSLENENFVISSSKSDIFSTFVDYRYGCGKLKLNSIVPPFEQVFKKYLDEDVTINEKAVLNIFQKCSNLYKALEGLI